MEPTRRQLLAGAAAAVGAMALPGAIERAYAVEPAVRTGTIKDVEHVVILMQENRSFDHYFGTYRGARGFGDPRPWLLPNGRTVWHQPPAAVKTSRYQNRGLPADAEYVLPWYLDSTRTSEYIAGTNHGWSSGHLAWNNGRYDEWVNQKQDVLTMTYLHGQDLKYHWALANAFTLCDAYFCSVHADTAPNRIYLWSGTIDATNTMGTKPNGPGLGERNVTNGYTWTTYAERLQNKGISWKVYQGGTGVPGEPTDNYTDNSLEFFHNFQRAEGATGPLPDQGASTHTLSELKQEVLTGKLPAVSWVVPPYKYSEHASATPTDGAYYIDTVLDALTADPEVWAKTVLIINYDENDGLFDHVVPPMPPVRNAPGTDGLVSASLAASLRQEILDLDQYPDEADPLIPGADPLGKQPIGLGPRVPMIVVSPWTKGGWVNSEVFDHTSVLRFLEKRFELPEPNVSAWRRSLCGDLTSAFDFTQRDAAVVDVPVPAPIKGAGAPFTVQMPQTMPRQEAGQRRARALPYRFDAALAEASVDEVTLALRNQGEAGCYFYVRDAKQPAAPRRYQVAAGEQVRDQWNAAGGYDLGVWGANGYLAEFAGDRPGTDLLVEVVDDGSDRLTLQLTSRDTHRQVLVANGYATGSGDKLGNGKPQRVTVPAGRTASVQIDVRGSHGWFDLTVTEPDNPAFRRRFAGHQENGKPSLTDPLLGQ